MSHIGEDKYSNTNILPLESLSLNDVAKGCHISRAPVGNVRAKYYHALPHPPTD
jgi:hypothetical protein